MTVRVLENDGYYTAYRLVIRRKDDGSLVDSVKQIDIPFPPPDGGWRVWAERLDEDQLEAGLQIYYDRWNFGTGGNGEHVVYAILCDERERRRMLGDRTDEVLKASLTRPQIPLSSHKKHNVNKK